MDLRRNQKRLISVALAEVVIVRRVESNVVHVEVLDMKKTEGLMQILGFKEVVNNLAKANSM